VIDTTGTPVAGARIRFLANTNREEESIVPDMARSEAHTDIDGKWMLENAPSKLDNVLHSITHPDFAREDLYSRIDGPAALKGTMITTLKVQGKDVAGIVLDKSGQPLAGAIVTSARDQNSRNRPAAQTDAQGRFQLRTTNDYEDALTITAAGHGPQIVSIRSGDVKNLKIQLGAPGKIEGAVFKADGTPLAGARVEVEQWRNQRSLPWNVTTDADGKFLWEEAPTDELTILVNLRGYSAARNIKANAGGAPLKITLHPAQVITGRVIDADTQQPVDNFRMIYGIRWSGQEDVTWQTSTGRKLGNGGFEYTANQFDNGGKIRIEADGYLPQSSRLIMASEGAVQLDFTMKKGAGPGGIVLNVAGQPVAGHDVHFIPPNTGFYFSDDQSMAGYNERTKKTLTDDAGRFSFAVAEESFRILIMGDQGMALVNSEQLAKSQNITLQPWGKIEGTLRIGTRAAHGTKLGVQINYPDNRYSATIMRTATADDQGRFVLDQVPPGNVSLFRIIPTDPNSSRYDQIGGYDVKPGQTLTVNAGGEGQPVIGKIIPAPGVTDAFDLNTTQVYASPKQQLRMNYPFPDNFPDLDVEEQQKWYQEFAKTPQFAEIQKQMSSMVTVQFTVLRDGSFRQDEVRPGTYQLHAYHREPWGGRTQPKVLGQANVSFTVPQLPNGVSDDPLDLGSISLKSPESLGTGSPMPGVKLVTTDGKPFKLDELRGKVVVLHVWSMHQYGMVPTIKQIHEKYRENSRLAVVNLGLNMLPAWIPRLAERQGLPGTLTMDEESYQQIASQTVMTQLGLGNMPIALIIDPEGRLAVRIDQPGALEPAVAKALGE
jgi:peroxiredoxin